MSEPSLAHPSSVVRDAVARARRAIGDPAAAARAVMADTLEVAAIPAPTGAEAARARWALARFPGATVDAEGDVVVAPQPGAGPPVVLAAHLDTVFGPETPLEARAAGDRLLAPGIGDNSLAVAALAAVADALGRMEPTGRPIVCAFTVGEEGRGDLRGARAVVADLAPFAFLAVEGHFGDRLATRAVGSTRLEAIMRGPGGHSWGDRGGPSAIHGLARAAALIADIPRSADGAVSVGVIAGGTSVNTLAAEARMEIDLRSAHPDELADLEARARRAIAAAAAREGLGRRGPRHRAPAGRGPRSGRPPARRAARGALRPRHGAARRVPGEHRRQRGARRRRPRGDDRGQPRRGHAHRRRVDRDRSDRPRPPGRPGIGPGGGGSSLGMRSPRRGEAGRGPRLSSRNE